MPTTYEQGGGSGSSGAPTDATYITQTANGTLSAEQALSSLATGLVKNTTGTGVLSIAAAGTDYAAADSSAWMSWSHFFTNNVMPSPWATTVINSGTANQVNAPLNTKTFGYLVLSTDGTTNGAATLGTSTNTFAFSGGTYTCEFAIASPLAVSDGTDTYTLRVGFLDVTNATPVDGIYFRYTDSVNAGKWECVTCANSVETATDSGIALSTNAYIKFKIIVNAAATSVQFYINDTLVQTNSTNIPTGTSRVSGFMFMIVKSAGTTARTLGTVYHNLIFQPTTPI